MKKLTKAEKATRVRGIAWKKAYCRDGNEVLVLLSFDPKTAEPRKGDYYVLKCPVTVLAIYDMWGYPTSIEETSSYHDRGFSYKVGQTVAGKSGIWAWPTFNEAADYWKNLKDMHAYDVRYDALGPKKAAKA